MNKEQSTTLALKKKQHHNLLLDSYVREYFASTTNDAKQNAINFELLNRKWKLNAFKANKIGNYKVNINAFELSVLDAYKQLKNKTNGTTEKGA
jgi:hypothetical protein